jgi:hypothetical protein
VPDDFAPDDLAPDDLGQRLRAGAAQLAADMRPSPAHLIRARGDQRRRHKMAGSLALALVVIAGGGGTAYALGQHAPRPPSPVAPAATATPSATPGHTATPAAGPTVSPGATSSPGATGSPGATSSPGATGSPGTTGSPGSTTTTRTIQLGPLTLRVPALWHVTYQDAQGDYTVSTTPCGGDDLSGAEHGSGCPAFSLIADAGPTSSPASRLHTYVPGQEYTISTGALGCPAKPYPNWLRDAVTQPLSTGYAPVAATRTADYTVWQIGCSDGAGAAPGSYFQQRDWYLPGSRILIVDEYSTPGLARILATATWAG